MSLPKTFLRGAEELHPLLGDSAGMLLDQKLQSFAGTLQVMVLQAKVDILMTYLANGTPVKLDEINQLAERQAEGLVLRAIADLKTEYGG